MLDRDLIKREFEALSGISYLNLASSAVPPKRVRGALCSFAVEISQNPSTGAYKECIVDDARRLIGGLVNAEPSDIAFVKNTCEGMSIIANGYPFSSDDNVIISDQEHPSCLYPWMNLSAQENVRLKVVESNGCNIMVKDIVDSIDDRTRAVVISAVQYSTGFFADIEAIGAECRRRNVLFVVDGIQAVGRLAIDVDRYGIDYLACGSHKGLLGITGAGFVYCRKDLCGLLTPPYAALQSTHSRGKPALVKDFSKIDWLPDARRLEAGSLNYAGIYAMSKGAELILELGIHNIEQYTRELERMFRERLLACPLDVETPYSDGRLSGIVSVSFPDDKAALVSQALLGHKVYATVRNGHIRFGIGFYNSPADIQAAVHALTEISSLV